jgi:hypothetical protein
VLAVHGCFGLAPHMGHRTDNICFKVSFSGFTTTVFSMVDWKGWSILLCVPRLVPQWESASVGTLILCVPERLPD